MGFFSSILGGSSSKSTQSSGYGALPEVAQKAMDAVTTQGQNLLLGGNGNSMFSPLAQTGQETQAFNLMQLPTTQQGVQSLVGNYLNPFQDYITQGINKQAEGDYSLYKQALSGAGQMGSNREFVNAAAADEARLNAIGGTMAGNYNNAQSTALDQNQQTIANLMTQGQFDRGLDTQGKQSELSALQAMAQLLGVYPATSEGTSKSSQSNGIGGLLQGAGAAMSLFSDRRLKDNIKKVGERNGFTLYEFTYKGQPEKFIGVMAQEVAEIMPNAVKEIDGFMAVDYGKLGFGMEAA